MNSKNLFFSLVVAAFLSSSIPTGSHKLEIGHEAPSLTLSSSSSQSLNFLKGKRVVVNFWSASDAASRLANLRMSQLASASSSDATAYVSICIDKDPSLANEIMKVDHISDKVISLGSADIAPEVISDYQTAKGCRSFAIDSYGNLEAIAAASEISKILS